MNKQNLIYGLILLILCFLLYYSTIDTFFTGEDFDNIGYQSLNTVIRNFIFKPDMNTGHFTRGITNTFWAIQYQLFGKNHIPYHIVNILLYWICSFLVFKLALNLLDQHEDKRLISYIAGILFAVLPVHAIVVNWLTLLFEKFCIIFFISAFLFWIRFKESKKRLYYILTLIFFIFSMLSKEEAITLPIIIFIYDKIYFWKKERSWRNIFDSWMIYIPFLAISLAYFPYRIYRFSGLDDINQHAAMNTHLLHKVKTILEMISQPFPYFFILIFCIGLFLKNRIFYFMTLWIAIVLIPVYHIPKEWRLYLASVGFCIALSVNLYDLINRFSRNKKADLKNKFIFLIIFIVLFSYNNIVQINHQWKSVTDLSKNLYTKFKKEIPDIPDNSKIYIAGLDYADDVCSTALFDTVVKFMYEKNVSVQNFDNFFLDLKDNKSLNPEQIQLLEYKNERINIKDDWKKRLLDKRWGAGIRSQQDLILNIIDENIENLQKSNPQLSFMIKDNCCILFTNQSTLKILFKNKDLTSTYLNSVRIKMKVPKVYANFCDFFWETKEGKIGRTRFNAEKSDEIEEYKLPLGIRDDWFMTDSISGFGLHLPASSIELCQIEFSRELPLKQLSNKNQIHKNDSLQPIPAIRK